MPVFSKIDGKWKSRDAKIKQLKNVSYIFEYFLKYVSVLKSINEGSQGSKIPEIMEMLGFGPSHNKTEILLDQN